jgi:hypothetical protein
MILRRVVENLKHQHWTAIGIEFVLLVSGVFIGIQAQQWNTERGERRLERVYLERILSDINLSIETNELNISRLEGYSNGQALVVESLRRCELPESKKDGFANGVSNIAKVGPSVFVLSTMDEMLSAGHFSLIQNPDIRDAMNGLARDAKYQANIFTAIYTQLASATTTTSQRTIRIYTGHKTPFDPVAWNEMEIDFAALCKDKPFQSALSNVRYLTDAQISLNSRAIDKLRQAKSELENELSLLPRTKQAAP